ncbi:response regulator transcription factor [Paraburkholderia metrosideri]|uniref:Sensory transduction protein regX3 n=1 Tax=Paraburkholderia metrosideri TaxID=580937 RepID=A0ABM8NCJ4_9BURK|nr:winged helix-turn-helix domain-containing protein [Paraburkholderia metrosideri]CAD6517386.1 Sensory transduction protein regX3 [Paraburkholderia metrosideri]
MRIVCVGASGAQRYLAEALAESNHSVVELDNVDDASYLASAEHVDAIIVLTSGGASDAARAFAVRPAHTVLAVIDRQGQKDARVAALEAGADICLDHPYDYAELHARLLAFCRQRHHGALPAAPRAASSAAFARPLLSAATRSLVGRDGSQLLLRKREYLLMDRLLRVPGEAVARDELVDYIFGEADADTTSLHLLVSRLRARLSQTNLPITLMTVPKLGYRVIVDAS